jgi:hypothetical protein
LGTQCILETKCAKKILFLKKEKRIEHFFRQVVKHVFKEERKLYQLACQEFPDKKVEDPKEASHQAIAGMAKKNL